MRAITSPPTRVSVTLPTLALVALAAVLVLLSSAPVADGAPTSAGSAPLPSAGLTGSSVLKIADNQVVNLLQLGKIVSKLTDSVQYEGGTSTYRTYDLTLSATVPFPLTSISVSTDPLAVIAQPMQMPGGADALPPLTEWTFAIHTSAGLNVTTSWSLAPTTGVLSQSLGWLDQSYVVVARTHPVLPIVIEPHVTNGLVAPSSGFVANGILSPSSQTQTDPGFDALAAATDPGIIRVSLTTLNSPTSWNTQTHLPVFGWAALNAILNFTKQMNASVYLSLPAGNWGNGNYLPSGMPLDQNVSVAFLNYTGQFPTLTSYVAYVHALALHVQAFGIPIRYWNVGNEVPRNNATEVAAFITLFNAAEKAIHKVLPNALVGSDVMMDPNYIDQFARNATGVGFLSFHYYALGGLCMNGATYCPPAGGVNGDTDATLIDEENQFAAMHDWLPPTIAVMDWKNMTGHWLPVLDSESNLNHKGGAMSPTVGTDPRIQTLFGAQWWAGMFISGAANRVQSLMYYTLAGPSEILPSATSQYGGWGFQMIRINGSSTTLYAPYWAAKLVGEGVPAKAPELVTTGSVPSLAEAQAFRDGTGVSVLIVNEVNATVRFDVSTRFGGFDATSLQVLDRNSYAESFDAKTQTEVLGKSGIESRPVPASGPVSFVLPGYGVALLREVPATHGPMQKHTGHASIPTLVSGSTCVFVVPGQTLGFGSIPGPVSPTTVPPRSFAATPVLRSD
jgi:hypothetical protein